MSHGRRTNGERLKRLAAEGRVSGIRGPRRPASLWRFEVTGKACADAQRLFLRLPSGPTAHAVTMDALGLLALFPDKRPSVAGQVWDVPYEQVAGERFYRLLIDDDCFGGRTLCAFFYPSARPSVDAPGAIHVVGLAWETAPDSTVARIRDRVTALIGRLES